MIERRLPATKRSCGSTIKSFAHRTAIRPTVIRVCLLRRHHISGCAERAPGPSLCIQCLRKLGGRNFNADHDIRRHGARQRNEVDAALARETSVRNGRRGSFLLSSPARSAGPSHNCQ